MCGVGEMAGPVVARGAGGRGAFEGREVRPAYARGGEGAQIVRVQLLGEEQLVNKGVDQGLEAGTVGASV